jgi:hypothetical protein
MDILSIYTRYKIPKNLQLHMLHVASVASYIYQYSKQKQKNKSVISALLLHDLGNLIKFDLSSGVALFDKSEQDLAYWLRVQKGLFEKYGNDEHKATIAMAKEIGASKDTLEFISLVGISDISTVLNSSSIDEKITVYSDFRIGPKGIISVRKRFSDIIERYGNRENFQGEKKVLEKRDLVISLEKQIESELNLFLDSIDEKYLFGKANALASFEIN